MYSHVVLDLGQCRRQPVGSWAAGQSSINDAANWDLRLSPSPAIGSADSAAPAKPTDIPARLASTTHSSPTPASGRARPRPRRTNTVAPHRRSASDRLAMGSISELSAGNG
jgi:hypothetical protein